MKNYAIEIKWALRFTLLTLAWAIGEKYIGLHDIYIDKYALYTNLFAIPAILFYVLAIIEKKKYFFNGVMTWTQGFISGVVLSFIITLFIPITQYIIYSSITPHFFEAIIEYKTKSPMITHHLSIDIAKKYFNMQSYMIQNSFSGLSCGIVTGALVSLFIRNKK